MSLERVREVFDRWLKLRVTGMERIGGGRNSQVFRVDTDGQPLALKAYFRHPDDRRDRLGTEYGSLSYLWANGVREIPEPLAADTALGWAVYQFIKGDKILPSQAGPTEVMAAVDLLARLRDLSRQPESRKLGPASEAFFDVRSVVENLRRRLERLRCAEGEDPVFGELRRFLEGRFIPLLDRVLPWCEARLGAAGMSFERELGWDQRTLSPSDFGFHNALKQHGGRIIFLDFEYFGWDDPAKMMADFLLHPAMNLTVPSQKAFAGAVFRRFADFPGLLARVESVYPLFGLKWCLIFLNEFLPDALLRREFAAIAAADRALLRRQQLAKACQMSDRIEREYQQFPYRD